MLKELFRTTDDLSLKEIAFIETLLEVLPKGGITHIKPIRKLISLKLKLDTEEVIVGLLMNNVNLKLNRKHRIKKSRGDTDSYLHVSAKAIDELRKLMR